MFSQTPQPNGVDVQNLVPWTIAFVSAIVAVLTYLLRRQEVAQSRADRAAAAADRDTAREERRKLRHEAVLQALQGGKEAVAFTVARLKNEPDRIAPDDHLLRAIFLSWIYESSDRTRAVIADYLRTLQGNELGCAKKVLAETRELFDSYAKMSLETAEGVRKHQKQVELLEQFINRQAQPKA